LTDLLITFAIEWWIPRQQYVHNDTTGPNVRFKAILFFKHLRGNVVGSPSDFTKFFVAFDQSGDPKVD